METVRPKRKLSFHQKQMRFFTVLFGGILVLVVVITLWTIYTLSFHR